MLHVADEPRGGAVLLIGGYVLSVLLVFFEVQAVFVDRYDLSFGDYVTWLFLHYMSVR